MMLPSHPLRLLRTATLLLAAGSLAAADTSLTTAIDYSTGKYGGDTRSTSLSSSVTGDVTLGAFTFGASTSYLRLEGAGVSIPGLGPLRSRVTTRTLATPGLLPRPGSLLSAPGVTTTTTAASTTQSGWGDLTLTSAWQSKPFGEKSPGLTLGLDAKLSTADATRGLGSGENDYTLRTAVAHAWEKSGISASLGYRFLGEPDGTTLRNGLQGSLAAWHAFTDRDTLSASLSLAERTTADVPGTATVTLSYTRTFRAGPALNLYTLAGLSDASPSFGTGVSLTFSF